MEKLYTKEELLIAIEYACGTQKAEDYAFTANILFNDNISNDHVKQILDGLYDVDNNISSKIDINDIFE